MDRRGTARPDRGCDARHGCSPGHDLSVASTYSYGATQLFTPARFPGGGGGEFTSSALYSGRPAAIRMGSVPVAWTNRYEYRSAAQPVHAGGEFSISVTLGAQAAEIAENARIGTRGSV
ncbi:hypothetical protein [Streptomyces sp. NPDC048411]|uniref:hypothetical protein n=1 Tax=Streptomyces sp. NPDC048411 TaxID=3157206 RepID=UPI0034562B2F